MLRLKLREDCVERLPLFWRDKLLAKKALKEILERREAGALYFFKFEDVAEKHPWAVSMSNGYVNDRQIALELDNGERKIISAFWNEDNFTRLKSLKILREMFKEEGDEVFF